MKLYFVSKIISKTTIVIHDDYNISRRIVVCLHQVRRSLYSPRVAVLYNIYASEVFLGSIPCSSGHSPCSRQPGVLLRPFCTQRVAASNWGIRVRCHILATWFLRREIAFGNSWFIGLLLDPNRSRGRRQTGTYRSVAWRTLSLKRIKCG